MSYVAYKLLHFTGVFVVMTTLVAAAVHALTVPSGTRRSYRKLLGFAHGIAVLVLLTGGFGMLARMGILRDGLPTWVILKMGVWLVLSAAVALPRRRRGFAVAVLIAVPALAVGAAALAQLKPF